MKGNSKNALWSLVRGPCEDGRGSVWSDVVGALCLSPLSVTVVERSCFAKSLAVDPGRFPNYIWIVSLPKVVWCNRPGCHNVS